MSSGTKRVRQKKGYRVTIASDDPLAGIVMVRYIEAFREWLEIMGRPPSGIRTRRQCLRRFAVWANDRGISDPREVTKPILERYQRYLFYYRKVNGEPLNLNSQITVLRTIRAFFSWLARQNHILYNPASELEVPRQPRQLPRYILSAAEMEALMNAPDTSTPVGIRDRALLELLYSTAMRRMEAANLSCYDVDVIQRLAFIRQGKGQRDRVVPIGARAVGWLNLYITEVRPELAPQDGAKLFVNDWGLTAGDDFITARVKRYLEAAGIDKPGAAHLLRHACATHMLEGGADVRFIQALLGHAQLTTTEIYTHVSIEKLRAVHDATHPARVSGRIGHEQTEVEAEVAVDAENATAALLDALADEAAEDDTPKQA